jgi:hypothetical protein
MARAISRNFAQSLAERALLRDLADPHADGRTQVFGVHQQIVRFGGKAHEAESHAFGPCGRRQRDIDLVTDHRTHGLAVRLEGGGAYAQFAEGRICLVERAIEVNPNACARRAQTDPLFGQIGDFANLGTAIGQTDFTLDEMDACKARRTYVRRRNFSVKTCQEDFFARKTLECASAVRLHEAYEWFVGGQQVGDQDLDDEITVGRQKRRWRRARWRGCIGNARPSEHFVARKSPFATDTMRGKATRQQSIDVLGMNPQQARDVCAFEKVRSTLGHRKTVSGVGTDRKS